MLGLLPSKADIRCIAETQHDGLEAVMRRRGSMVAANLRSSFAFS